MKSKPNTSCLREGSNLHVCHNSTKISKDSSNQVKTFQKAIVQDNLTASAILKTTDDCHSNIPTEVPDNQDSCGEEIDQISCLPLVASTNASIEIVPHQMACSSLLEINFSQISEHGESENKCTRAVVPKHDELPHLIAADSVEDFCGLNDYQSFSLSDSDISDLVLPNMDFSDLIASTPDHDHINYESTFVGWEDCTMFPFTEKSLDAGTPGSNICDSSDSSEEENITSLYYEYLQFDQQNELISPTDDAVIEESFDPHFFIMIPGLSEVSSITPLPSPQKEMKMKPVTLVLDLDETLIHSTTHYRDNADFNFLVYCNTNELVLYVTERPHLRMFLKRVAQMFQVIIFTASQRSYADKLLDILDPDKKIFSRRFFRDSCVFSEGRQHVKDLTILGTDLAKVAIIDNTPEVYRLQVNNGIPIKSWFDDPHDNELMTLLPFLETLVEAEDVRPLISQLFHNKSC